MPRGSYARIRRAAMLLHRFASWSGLPYPSCRCLRAFAVARCAPPVSAPLPSRWPAPVLPQTVAGEIDALRRGARLRLFDLHRWLPFLSTRRMTRFLTALGGRLRPLHSTRHPFLAADARRAWQLWGSAGGDVRRDTLLRDATALCLGYATGARAGQLLALRRADVTLIGSVVRVTFRSTKTNRSVLGVHLPQVVHVAFPETILSIARWSRRLDVLGVAHSEPLFPRLPVNRPIRPMAAGTLRRCVKKIAPLCTSHSLRVGLATEAVHTGAPLTTLRALGGWRSDCALHYVVPTSVATVAASRRLAHSTLTRTGTMIH